MFREVLRQGERLLALQDEIRESTLRRAGELLRLAVATVAAVLVLAGLFVTAGKVLDPWALLGFAAGVALVLLSSGLLAFLLNGSKRTRGFAYGPDLRRVVPALGNELQSTEALLRSFVEPMPDWIQENLGVLRHMDLQRSRALGLLAVGVLVISATLLYILGGAIHG